MNYGLSDQVRAMALEKFIYPAQREGKAKFSVAVKDLMRLLEPHGFPSRNWPQICTAIQAEKFLRAHGLEIEGVDGPPRKQSPRVVVRYRFKADNSNAGKTEVPAENREILPQTEDPAARAFRLTEKLRGILKEEFAEYGGGEAFLRWVRSEDEDAA